MLSLPITGSPLKKSFHTAAGTVDLATDGDVWKTLVDANAPFSRDVDQIAEVRQREAALRRFTECSFR